MIQGTEAEQLNFPSQDAIIWTEAKCNFSQIYILSALNIPKYANTHTFTVHFSGTYIRFIRHTYLQHLFVYLQTCS